MCSLLRSPFSLPQANWYPHIHKASSQIFTNTWLSSVWLPGKQVSRLCCNDQLNIQLNLTTATISGALDTVENHLIVLTWLKAISTIHPTYEKNYIHSDNMQSEENKIKRHNTCSYFTHRQTYTQKFSHRKPHTFQGPIAWIPFAFTCHFHWCTPNIFFSSSEKVR